MAKIDFLGFLAKNGKNRFFGIFDPKMEKIDFLGIFDPKMEKIDFLGFWDFF